jgi:hypothetical protein
MKDSIPKIPQVKRAGGIVQVIELLPSKHEIQIWYCQKQKQK